MKFDLTNINLAQLSKHYAGYKTKIEELTKLYEAKLKDLEEVQNDILQEINKRMATDELKNIKMEEGTFYYTTKTRIKKVDEEAFFNFAKEHDRFDLLNIQPLKTGVVQYIKEHDIVPAGCEFATWEELTFRKA